MEQPRIRRRRAANNKVPLVLKKHVLLPNALAAHSSRSVAFGFDGHHNHYYHYYYYHYYCYYNYSLLFSFGQEPNQFRVLRSCFSVNCSLLTGRERSKKREWAQFFNSAIEVVSQEASINQTSEYKQTQIQLPGFYDICHGGGERPSREIWSLFSCSFSPPCPWDLDRNKYIHLCRIILMTTTTTTIIQGVRQIGNEMVGILRRFAVKN